MEYILGLHVSVPGLYQTGLARLPPEPADDPPCSALTRKREGFCRRKKTEKSGGAVRRCEPTTPDKLIAATVPPPLPLCSLIADYDRVCQCQSGACRRPAITMLQWGHSGVCDRLGRARPPPSLFPKWATMILSPESTAAKICGCGGPLAGNSRGQLRPVWEFPSSNTTTRLSAQHPLC
jgi:hypothetical protein